jgi:hypothetical protein
MSDPCRGYAMPSRRRSCVVGLTCLLASGARAQTFPYVMRTEPCPVLNDVFESTKADAADQARRGEALTTIDPLLLDRMSKTDPVMLQRFFQCFHAWEPPVSEAMSKQGVVRIVTATIVVGYISVQRNKDNPTLQMELPLYAGVTCRYKSDGTKWCWGHYSAE